MTALDRYQLEVARILFGLPTADGFVLAGGSALVAQGAVDRTTRDIDAFVASRPGTAPGDVLPLSVELTAALTDGGWVVTHVRTHTTFARLVAARGEASVEIDLAVDSPPLFPIIHVDGLPVLAPQDLAARKILAILDRAEGRDFTDLHSLSLTLGRGQTVSWALQLDAGVTLKAIADGFDKIQRLADADLPTGRPATVRSSFADWSKELRLSNRPGNISDT